MHGDLGWHIEELSADHDRSAFSCGHLSLDDFLKKFAGQNQRSGISRTYVAIGHGDPHVCGYYSVSAGAVLFADIPEKLRKRLPKYPVPVAHLGRLAVDAAAQGQGLGELLLMDALARIVGIADSIGIHAVEVVAIDEIAKRFSMKYGFTALLDDPHHLYISIKTLRKLKRWSRDQAKGDRSASTSSGASPGCPRCSVRSAGSRPRSGRGHRCPHLQSQ